MSEHGDQAICNNCRGWIEFDSESEPPWVHQDTGFSDCPDDEDSHAEPEEA